MRPSPTQNTYSGFCRPVEGLQQAGLVVERVGNQGNEAVFGVEVWGKRYRVSGSSFWVKVVFRYYDLTRVLPSCVSVLFLILFTSISPLVSLFLATTCCFCLRWHHSQTKYEQDQSTCFSPLALKQVCKLLEGFYRF